MSSITRRMFVRQAGPLALAAPAVAAASSPGTSPGPIATEPDPALARVALNLSAAIDRQASLIPGYENDDKDDTFTDGVWEPAAHALHRAEHELEDALQARGLAGVVADGRVFLGGNRVGMDWPDAYPESISVAELGTIAGLTPVPTVRTAPPPDPELAAIAGAMNDALDRAFTADTTIGYLTDPKADAISLAAAERLEAGVFEPAIAEAERLEVELRSLLRARGLDGVTYRGRTMVDFGGSEVAACRGWLSQRFSYARAGRILNLDEIGGPAR